MKKVYAPFNRSQVEKINSRQADETLHPYTCGGCVPSKVLHANESGLFCAFCNYQQDWVLDGDA
jgi:hypothetical protein